MHIRQSLHPHPHASNKEAFRLPWKVIYKTNNVKHASRSEHIIWTTYYFHLHAKVKVLVAATMKIICITFLIVIMKTEKAFCSLLCLQVIHTAHWTLKRISIKMLLFKPNIAFTYFIKQSFGYISSRSFLILCTDIAS